MQSQDHNSSSFFVQSTPVASAPLDSMFTPETDSNRRKQDFIDKYKKADTEKYGCISDVSLDHLSPVENIEFFQTTCVNVPVEVSACISAEQAVDRQKEPGHISCMAEETVDLLLAGLHRNSDDIDELLLSNMALLP